MSDNDSRSGRLVKPGRLVKQVGQMLEGTRVVMERTRVAKDGTNRPVVIRVSISIVSEALLISMPSYGRDPVVGHPCLLKLADSSFPDAVVNVLFMESSLPSIAMFLIYVSVVRIPTGCEEYHTSS